MQILPGIRRSLGSYVCNTKIPVGSRHRYLKTQFKKLKVVATIVVIIKIK